MILNHLAERVALANTNHEAPGSRWRAKEKRWQNRRTLNEKRQPKLPFSVAGQSLTCEEYTTEAGGGRGKSWGGLVSDYGCLVKQDLAV